MIICRGDANNSLMHDNKHTTVLYGCFYSMTFNVLFQISLNYKDRSNAVHLVFDLMNSSSQQSFPLCIFVCVCVISQGDSLVDLDHEQ